MKLSPEQINQIFENNSHLKNYVEDAIQNDQKIPEFYLYLNWDLSSLDDLNIIYPIGDPIFIHIFGSREEGRNYNVISPELDEDTLEKFNKLINIIFSRIGDEELHEDRIQLEPALDKIIKENISVINPNDIFSRLKLPIFKVPLTSEQLISVKYHIKRNLLDLNLIEPLIRDPYLEDITCIGLNNIHIYHRIFGSLQTNLKFKKYDDQIKFLTSLGDRLGKPVSPSTPIVDYILPEGSRLNLVYDTTISLQGPTLSIRKYTHKPLSIPQLIKWGTLNAELAAYLWLCLEHNMSIFICGETASGKTSTLNGLLPFIDNTSKIYSCEDVPEVQPPHDVWEQLLTRDSGPEEFRVDMFELLKAALRSRPDYMLVGEIRGQEGAEAIQAMQSGSPVLATFHALTVQSLVQRFTSKPINVPIRYMDHINVVVMQNLIRLDDMKLRRVTSVDEIIGYSDEFNGILTRNIFKWNPENDTHIFTGKNNSHHLENKIGRELGYTEEKNVYQILNKKTKILEKMVNLNIIDYQEFVNKIFTYQKSKSEKAIFGLKR